MHACLLLSKMEKKEELRQRCTLNVETVLVFKHTFSGKWSAVLARRHLALGRQKCHGRWADQLLPAMGKSERTHAQLLSWETASQGPSPGRQGAWSLCTGPSPMLCSPPPLLLAFACSILWLSYRGVFFHPLEATI